MSWITGWSNRKAFSYSRPSGAVTDYQIKILVGESSTASGDILCTSGCSSDFSDIRFTTSDGTTLLNYWIESITGTTPNQVATVWVKLDFIGTSSTVFYLYYGNTVTSSSSGSNTFNFFEDFNSLTNGNLNGQNSWSGSTSFQVEDTTKYEGGKAVQVSNVTAGQIDHTLSQTYQTFIELYLRGSDTSKSYPIEFYLMEGSTQITGAGIHQGTIQHLYSSGWGNIGSASNDQWYKIRIEFYGSNYYRIYINGSYIGAATSFNAISSTIDKIRLEQYTASGAGVFYCDSIKIGKYVEAEPALNVPASEDFVISKIVGYSVLGPYVAPENTQQPMTFIF